MINKMNPKVKKKWVKALRSGEYKQTRGKLKGKVGYCCLGVLCDLYCKETGTTYHDAIFGYNSALPDSVEKWAGLSGGDPYIYERNNKAYSASCMNDTQKKNFNQIADAIQENL